MRLIEIQEGVAIDADKIEGIKMVGDTCEVYIGSKTYLSTLPYSALTQMLKLGNVVDNGLTRSEEMEKTMAKVSAVLDKAQHFAG